MFILLTCRKASEWASNYPTCFRRCQDIAAQMKFNTACQDHQAGRNAVKCLSKETTEWRE